MSPRSGTPVKLLGREDASVDWYNLEKSKRVKAFRCGEFDACIERAEALQGVPIKKREKYARREDAILHALELEKQILEERHHKVGSISSIKDSGFLKEESDGTLPSGSDLRSGESLAPGKFINYEKFDLPFVEEPMGNLLYAENLKSCGLLKYEDSFSEATPPFMRGLQDFGLQTCTSKRKLAASGSYECSQKSFLMDNHAHALRGSIKDEEGWNNSSNSERFSPLKKKRFPSGFSEEGLGKRRDRRKPLLQVLQSSAKLPASQSSLSNCGNVQEERAEISVTCNSDKNLSILIPEGPNVSLYGAGYASDYMQISPSEFRHPVFLGEENASSGLVDPNERDISATFCLDPEMEDETLLRGTSQPFSPESRNSGRSVEDDCVTFHTPENNGNVQNGAGLFPSASECPHEQTEDTAVDVGVSRWNLKGKRNVRNLSRRTTDSADNKNRNGFISFANGGSYESKRSSLNSERERFVEQSFSSQADDFDSSSFTRKDRESELPLHGYNSYSLMLKGASGGLRDNNMVNSDDDSHGLSPSSKEAYALSRTQWDRLGPRFGQRSSERMESMLVDVTLKVQASSQGERVPLVSLMSKLNGKAIVGHPVQIEKLDDGSTNSLFPKHDSEVPSGYSGNAMPPPVWRTGRRTLMQRVPRPHPASSALEDSDTPVSDRESRLMFKRPYAVHLNGQAKLMKKSSLGQRPMHRKSKKKSSKKVSLSNQKTKRLSSIAMEPKHVSVSGRPASETNIRDVLVKPGNAVPVVACVPVKVLFSRILEAVGRTPSTTAACRSPSTDMADQEPS